MDLKECFERGYLKQVAVEKGKIENSFNLSEHFLSRARGNLGMEYNDVAFMMAYNSMLHTAKALLFSKGYSERNHFCMIALLQSEFTGEVSKFLDILDSYRVARHSIQYRGASCALTDAKEAIDDAEKFLKLAKKELA
jgi:uncharacterized protein (UPF0332 family)